MIVYSPLNGYPVTLYESSRQKTNVNDKTRIRAAVSCRVIVDIIKADMLSIIVDDIRTAWIHVPHGEAIA